MFRAIFRLFRAVGYLLTGNIDKARKALMSNPNVVRASFDDVIREKKRSFDEYKSAVAGQIVQTERKQSELEQRSKKISELEKLRKGAELQAKSLVEQLKNQGMSQEDIKKNAEYIKCSQAFSDFSSKIQTESELIKGLETAVKTNNETVGRHKAKLQSMLRDIEQLAAEKHETLADLAMAEEDRKISDMFSAVSTDSTNERLRELRELRAESKAQAKVSSELAGINTSAADQEFLAKFEQSVASNEFDALMGVAAKSEETVSSDLDKNLLPER